MNCQFEKSSFDEQSFDKLSFYELSFDELSQYLPYAVFIQMQCL